MKIRVLFIADSAFTLPNIPLNNRLKIFSPSNISLKAESL